MDGTNNSSNPASQGNFNPNSSGGANPFNPPSQMGNNQGASNQPSPGQMSGGFPPPPPASSFSPGMNPPPSGGVSGPFPTGGSPLPPPPPEDTTPANFQLGSQLPPVIDINVPTHNLQFDEQYFLHLLAGSISLTKDEKARIIESIPKLRQSQIDELIRIFEEERRKFAELSAKHVDQLKKLEKQAMSDWQDIGLQQKAGEKKNQDQAQADEIRKKLGL